MTALSVWWRRNFGHRNDPPELKSQIRRALDRADTAKLSPDTSRAIEEMIRASHGQMTRPCHPLREWWRHRNDPPPMLPDPVTWTLALQEPHAPPLSLVDRMNETEDHTDKGGDKWRLISVARMGTRSLVSVRREDGAYRWRDDSMRGF